MSRTVTVTVNMVATTKMMTAAQAKWKTEEEEEEEERRAPLWHQGECRAGRPIRKSHRFHICFSTEFSHSQDYAVLKKIIILKLSFLNSVSSLKHICICVEVCFIICFESENSSMFYFVLNHILNVFVTEVKQ